jgi:uncharacterized membrane protein YqhA
LSIKLNKIEYYFEKFLYNFRFLALIAVLGSLLSSILMFIRGTMLAFYGLQIFILEFSHIGTHSQEESEILPLLISSVDNYLFATVLLIFSLGIYELFISKIDMVTLEDFEGEGNRPNWLKISSLDDLKNSLGKVIIMILIVSFFEHSLKISYKSSLDLLFLAVGIFLIAGALYLKHKSSLEMEH